MEPCRFERVAKDRRFPSRCGDRSRRHVGEEEEHGHQTERHESSRACIVGHELWRRSGTFVDVVGK